MYKSPELIDTLRNSESEAEIKINDEARVWQRIKSMK